MKLCVLVNSLHSSDAQYDLDVIKIYYKEVIYHRVASYNNAQLWD